MAQSVTFEIPDDLLAKLKHHGVVLLGAGGIGLAFTLAVGLVNPGLFDIAREALSVSHAGERPLELPPGIAGSGHKLLEVWKNRAEFEAAVTTPTGDV